MLHAFIQSVMDLIVILIGLFGLWLGVHLLWEERRRPIQIRRYSEVGLMSAVSIGSGVVLILSGALDLLGGNI